MIALGVHQFVSAATKDAELNYVLPISENADNTDASASERFCSDQNDSEEVEHSTDLTNDQILDYLETAVKKITNLV